MDDDGLIRKLNSEKFSLFKDYAEDRVRKADVIEKLVQENISNDAGAAIRCSNAILIFRAGREIDALRIIARSRVHESIREKAQMIIATNGTSDLK